MKKNLVLGIALMTAMSFGAQPFPQPVPESKADRTTVEFNYAGVVPMAGAVYLTGENDTELKWDRNEIDS